MSYVYVENNQIKEIHYFLPKNWRNISNFNILNDEELLNFSWYKLIDYIPEYDTSTHEPYSEEIIFEDGIAKRKYLFREKIIPIEGPIKLEEIVTEDVTSQTIEEPINTEEIVTEDVILQTTDDTTST